MMSGIGVSNDKDECEAVCKYMFCYQKFVKRINTTKNQHRKYHQHQ